MIPEPDNNTDPGNPNNPDLYVQEIDNQYMNSFRDLLNEYIQNLASDISEIAEGLNLSRPLVGEFIKRKRNELPLSVGRICHLHKTLIETDKLDNKRRGSKKTDKSAGDNSNSEIKSIHNIRNEAKVKRDLLKKEGPDRLLIAAGFQPIKMKMLPVYPEQYAQFSFIIFICKDRPLSQDIFSLITERELEPKSEQGYFPIQELEDNPWIDIKIKDEIKYEYRNQIEILGENLHWREQAGIFSSIMHNQLTKKEEIKFDLKVVRVERIPLSLTWDIKENPDLHLLWHKIKDVNNICQQQLGNYLLNQDQNIYPVSKTIITCKYDDLDGEKEINFEYISTGTHVRTAISAISLNMGFYHLISRIKVDVKCLKEDIRSLIKASVVLREESKDNHNEKSYDRFGESVLGEWVSTDLLQSILQANIIASKKWLFKKIDSKSKLVEQYIDIVENTAKIRSDFYKNRLAFDEYDFNDSIVNIDEFKKIKDSAQIHIEKLEKTKSTSAENHETPICNNLLSNFYRISISSEIYQLHHHNIQSNHHSCNRSLADIDKSIYEFENMNSDNRLNEILIPFKIILEAEKILYNLSFGIQSNRSILQEETLGETVNLLTVDNILECLTKMDERVQDYLKRYIQKTTFSNDPGYDIHHSLGSYYSHTGRLLLYRSQNSKDIQSAGDRLLKAVYYFHRIGLSRKVERNFTLAGRVKVRSQKIEYAKQFKEYSEFLLKKNISKINAAKNDNFESAMRSRLNSLEGEYSLIIDENPQKSLEFCLEALRGALWLGLNRHIVDNLYTISRCAMSLQNRSIQADLESKFPGLGESSIVDKPDELMYAKFIHTPSENKIAKEIICRLFKIRKESDALTCWSDIADRFKEASQEIWNIWYRTATGDKEGKHPFAEAIEAGTFLAPIDPLT
jgi:hypothetical protein